jgi:two-component system LytT family response regulator
MNIAICDDENTNLEMLEKHIAEYAEAHCLKANIFATTFPKEILNNDTAYDLAFLDIQMPETDGITLAKELKNRNGKVVIFFVTNFEKYQDEAMDLHIFRFFEKPFDVQRLYASLDKALQYIDETYIDLFLYNDGEDKKILVDDIVYIRRENRKVILLTKDGNEYVTRRDLNQWIEQLPNTFFYQVHKSFLVNMHYITKNSYSVVWLNDSIQIPVASRKQVAFHKYWFQYLKRR